VSYVGEFRINWQSLLATFIGIGTGSAISHYTMSMFAPELIAEFGWSKSQFALVGSLPIVTMFVVPFAGRFTDRFGTRLAATIGFAAMSLGFAAFSLMSGDIVEFFAIWLVQHILGVLSTSLVLSRFIVERFNKARGSALSVLMTGPPLSGAIAAPLLGAFMAAEGWRAAFVALAVISAVGGLICVTFMSGGTEQIGTKQLVGKSNSHARLTREELLALVRNRTFLLLVAGMFLINIPQVFASSQLKLVVLSAGVADQVATWMVSLYAMGVIAGRITFGLALDRVRAHVVAIFALSLPAIGFLILASSAAVVWLLAFGVFVIGVAQGAEGDIGGYMISRYFDLKNYSLILGFVKSGLDGGGAIGALILSYVLHATGGYGPFLLLAAVTTIVGAVCFFLTGYSRPREMAAQPIAPEAS
jgi:MFS family permease